MGFTCQNVFLQVKLFIRIIKLILAGFLSGSIPIPGQGNVSLSHVDVSFFFFSPPTSLEKKINEKNIFTLQVRIKKKEETNILGR